MFCSNTYAHTHVPITCLDNWHYGSLTHIHLPIWVNMPVLHFYTYILYISCQYGSHTLTHTYLYVLSIWQSYTYTYALTYGLLLWVLETVTSSYRCHHFYLVCGSFLEQNQILGIKRFKLILPSIWFTSFHTNDVFMAATRTTGALRSARWVILKYFTTFLSNYWRP